MGKGGALNTWIREFCALVFTQTIQAFIYMLIISIIMLGMTNSSGSADDHNAALGLMSVFALLSVFKVEEMIKKIFGLRDTKASHGNAMKSIAKTAIAAKLGKRVLDNMGKVTGGIGAITKAGQDRKKAIKRFEEDMADNGFVKDDNGKLNYVGRKGTAKPDSVFNNPGVADSNLLPGGGAGTNAGTDSAVEAAEASINAAAKANAKDSGALSAADQRRMRNAFRNYEDKLSDINKAKRDGVKSIISGGVESVGSVMGGLTGGVLGGADGDIDEMLQGIMAGAGVGDALGASVVNTMDKAVQFAQRNYKREAGMSKKQAQKVIDSYKDAVKNVPKDYTISNIDYLD